MSSPEVPTSHRDTTRRLQPGWLALGVGLLALGMVIGMILGQRPPSSSAADRAPTATTASTPESIESPQPDPAADESASPAQPGEPAPLQPPANRGMLHVKPSTVEIPSIDVRSSMVELGLNPDNSLEVPSDYAKAGWYTGGSYPGDAGGPPALIVGHFDDENGPAVFYRLKEIVVGDEIRVNRVDGSVAVFVVHETKQYPKEGLPTQDIYADRKDSELVLITCSGQFDSEEGSYLDNYVVTAVLDSERSGAKA